MEPSFLGLWNAQWIALLTAMLALLLLADALVGHLRARFWNRAMFLPFVTGGLLSAAALLVVFFPTRGWSQILLQGTSWLAIATGIVGAVFHQVYGVAKQPGGYGWLLHHLMYGAPALAPLGLTSVGLVGLATSARLAGEATLFGMTIAPFILIVVGLTLLGLVLQTGVLHYRGAFNNPIMFLPMTIPVLAALGVLAIPFASAQWLITSVWLLLWTTFLVGFIGLGMHLRGFDRMMGGLYVPKFNLFEGPPAWAPAHYAGFAIVGLLALPLL
ncbi:MAG: hypothetical protein ACNA8W_18085 [Bradymonadaceae bacterium]